MRVKNNLEKFKKFAGEVDFGTRLKLVRQRSGLNQSELGKKFGKSSQFISDTEKMRRPISFETVLNYAIHCEDNTSFLLGKYYEYTLEASGIKNMEVIIRKKEPLKKSA